MSMAVNRMRDDAGALGWAGALMRWLAWAVRLVALNLLWVLGALAGGVLLGVFPATFAVTEVLRRAREGEDALWRPFWATWRVQFRRSNLLGVPFWALAVLVAADVAAFLATADPVLAWLLVPFAIAALGAALAAVHLAPVALRYDVPVTRVWRWVFLAPLSAPLVSIVLVMGFALWTAAVWWWPLLIVLGGASVPLLFADSVIARRLA